ncbi:unnamed protein product [Bursaphelenchus xylophilus]|uniref:(pine wood nematode) hypothetical protein n=1 Tax=Bursaphelenchus xylophilus TaxID=6326 RepID=A0A1I7S0D1_BURXY|nr:unnamed protein product [Bursaphelenchus xylophilus]CAG9132213.1 unnamed protein product [Bursaphelenchus xylophilus]
MTEVDIQPVIHEEKPTEPAPEEPEWSAEELHRLLDLCTRFREWTERATKLNDEFGSNHDENFFTADTLQHKFSRLSGESCGKEPDMEIIAWIKQFLKRTTTERNSSGDVAKIARIRRHFELWQHASRGKLTDHQLEEIMGIQLCKRFLNSDDFPENEPDKQQWLDADLFRSKLSKDEWVSLRNPEELITRLKNQTVTKERFLFDHPDLIKAEKEAERLKKEEEDARLMSPPELKRKRTQPPSPAVPESPKPEEIAPVSTGPDIIMIPPEPEVVIKRLKSPEQPSTPVAVSFESKVVEEEILPETPKETVAEEPVKVEEEEKEPTSTEQPVAKRLRGRSATASSDISTPTTSAQPSPAVTPSTRSSPRHVPISPQKEKEPTSDSEKRTLRTRKPAERPESPKKVTPKEPEDKEPPKKEVLDNGFEPESGPTEVEEPRFAAPELTRSCSVECQTLITFVRINKPYSTSNRVRKLDRKNSAPKEIGDTAQCSQESSETLIKTENDDQIVEFPNVGLQTEPFDLRKSLDEEILYVGENMDEAKVFELIGPQRERSEQPETPKEPARKRSRARLSVPEKPRSSKDNVEPKSERKLKIVVETDLIPTLYPFLGKMDEKTDEDQKSEASDTSRSSSKRRSARRSTLPSSQESKKSLVKAPKPPTLFLESAHLLRNPDAPVQQASTRSPHDPIIRSAHNIILQQKSASDFLEPVSSDVQNYHEFVKFPMDLSTIQKFIDEGRLKTMGELQELYNLMCANAIMFNENGHTVNLDAKELKKICFETIRELVYAPQRKVTKRHSVQTSRFSTRRLTNQPTPKVTPHHASQPHLVPGTAKPALPLTRRTFVNAAMYRTRRFKQEKPEEPLNTTAPAML